MPTLTEVGTGNRPAPWRAAIVVLCSAFPSDGEVWARFDPDGRCDLLPLLRDQRRPMGDRVLLAVAQGLVDGRTVVPVAELTRLDNARLRLAIDALAIARGSFPALD